MKRLLLCTDLDRTLLPNGQAPESGGARALFARLTAQPAVTLVYVTGRSVALVREAIATWKIPVPDLLIADVGTTIATASGDRWDRWTRWEEIIAADWAGNSPEDLKGLLAGLADLNLQGASGQGRFKLSYFTPAGASGEAVAARVRRRLDEAGIRANVIWSVDDTTGSGLLDILPVSATKRLAIEFVMSEGEFGADEVVFAGDSGNDRDVLISPVAAVLVANADSALRRSLIAEAEASGWQDFLYCATGGALNMNGNYAAGILEGIMHYQPAWAEWLKERA
jgi:HAD superfamily hydrolase (TIGR01484 family)